MPNCCIKWCGKNTKTSSCLKDGVSFHRFPNIPEIKAKWIEATRRENWYPQEYNVICSRHFTPDCFDNSKQRRRIYHSAVPTLYLPILMSPDGASDLNETDDNVPGPSEEYILPISLTPSPTDPQHENTTPWKRIMQRQIDHLIYALNKKKKDVKRLQDKSRLQEKKIAQLKDTIITLTNKCNTKTEKEEVYITIDIQNQASVKQEIQEESD